MLGASMSGEMLKPFIIYKGLRSDRGLVWKGMRKAENGFIDTIVPTVQGKAWMDELVMLEWIQLIWKPFCETKMGKKPI